MSSKDRTATPDTPECWHWAITLQQIEQIRRDDRKTIDKVYFDNLPKFRRIEIVYVETVTKWILSKMFYCKYTLICNITIIQTA